MKTPTVWGHKREELLFREKPAENDPFVIAAKTHATIFLMCTCIHAIAASALAAYRARGGSTMRRDKSHTDDNKRTVKCPCEVKKVKNKCYLISIEKF